jgi:hypothetical protein
MAARVYWCMIAHVSMVVVECLWESVLELLLQIASNRLQLRLIAM